MYIRPLYYMGLFYVLTIKGLFYVHDTIRVFPYVSRPLYYRIAGYFRGVPIFVIFVTHRQVTKFSTHEIFNP